MPHTLSEAQCRGLVSICVEHNAEAVRFDGINGEEVTMKSQAMRVSTFDHLSGWNEDGYVMRPSGCWAPHGSLMFREPVPGV